jgi:hypothetical protein
MKTGGRWLRTPVRPVGWVVAVGRGAGAVLRDPVIVILLLAGVAELFAGDPLVDGLTLLTVAAALGLDRVRRRRPAGAPVHGRGWGERLVPGRLTPALVAGWLLYSLAAGGLARFSWAAMVAAAVPGVVGVASGWWAAPRAPAEAAPTQAAEAAPIRAGGAPAWAALFVALALLELGAWLLQPSLTTASAAHPTISALLDPVLASHPERAVGFAAWLALGWFLVRQ